MTEAETKTIARTAWKQWNYSEGRTAPEQFEDTVAPVVADAYARGVESGRRQCIAEVEEMADHLPAAVIAQKLGSVPKSDTPQPTDTSTAGAGTSPHDGNEPSEAVGVAGPSVADLDPEHGAQPGASSGGAGPVRGDVAAGGAEAHRLSEEDLTDIEARANAATPGPWRVDRHQADMDQETGESVSVPAEPEEDALYCSIMCDAQTHEIAHTAEERPNPPDAAFIAAARSDVPRLLAEVRRCHDLGKTSHCVWCGHTGPKEQMITHIHECVKHPMGALSRRIEVLMKERDEARENVEIYRAERQDFSDELKETRAKLKHLRNLAGIFAERFVAWSKTPAVAVDPDTMDAAFSLAETLGIKRGT
jgi:hypothetical protein